LQQCLPCKAQELAPTGHPEIVGAVLFA